MHGFHAELPVLRSPLERRHVGDLLRLRRTWCTRPVLGGAIEEISCENRGRFGCASGSDHVRLRGSRYGWCRDGLRDWLSRFDGVDAVFTTEGCTGWRFIVEELERAGIEAHVAEPADTATLRGCKWRTKTDRGDARHLRRSGLVGSPSRPEPVAVTAGAAARPRR